MNSFALMMEAGAYLPEHIGPWLMWMQLMLFAAPVLFLKFKPARVLLLSQVLNTLVAYVVFVAEGHQVTKLFGLGHFFWVFPLWYLAKDIPTDKFKPYRVYAATTVLTISVSLVFDVRDTALWILGDRDSVLVNVPTDSPLLK